MYFKISDIDKMSMHSSCCRHRRADQVRSTAKSLPALEIAV